MITTSLKNKNESIKNIDIIDKTTHGLFWFLDHVFGQENVNLFLSKEREYAKARLLKNVSKSGQKGRTIPIERIKYIGDEKFKELYMKQGVPVVIEGGAKDWECVKKWTPEYLAEMYGNDTVALIDASPQTTDNINYKPEVTTLRDVILSMDDGPLQKYSRFNRILYDHPELKNHFDVKWMLRMRNLISSGQTFQVFIGGKGSKTHTHCASEHNIFTQVYGRKHWYIYPPEYDCAIQPNITRAPYFQTGFDPEFPDFEKYPAMEYLDRYECTLEAGDILFNPPSYWHHVSNLTGSIGVAFRWFDPFDSFKIDFIQTLLTILSVNPPIWVAAINRTDFPKIFEYMDKKTKNKNA